MSHPIRKTASSKVQSAPDKRRKTFDCLNCPGYCCGYHEIDLKPKDIPRLAKHLELTIEEAKKHHLKQTGKRWLFRMRKDPLTNDMMCKFFHSTRRVCTIYEGRPEVCRNYPYSSRCAYYELLKWEMDRQGESEFHQYMVT